MKREELPAALRKPRSGFVADDQGRLIYLPPVGRARLVPTKDEAIAFAIAVNRCFIGLLVLWAVAGIALVVFEHWPVKKPFEWLIVVFVARIFAASLLAQRWPQATGRTVNHVPVAAAALAGQGSGRLAAKLLLYGLFALLGFVGMATLPFVLHANWTSMPPWDVGRIIMLIAVSVLFAALFATNAHRVQLALRHRRRSGGAVSR